MWSKMFTTKINLDGINSFHKPEWCGEYYVKHFFFAIYKVLCLARSKIKLHSLRESLSKVLL